MTTNPETITPARAAIIEEITERIFLRFGCRGVHLPCESSYEECGRGEMRVGSHVEAFALVGHSSASTAYAWKLVQKHRNETPRIPIYFAEGQIKSAHDAFETWYLEYFAAFGL